ncbi:hypothetical protein GF380_05240 [Candidatus Uhrbacteria bacterium]|nr:hypothetical protein [Candidatus Uhrbacteria bacterium]MBD3284436.1 hypothetical protein [Candidatus Uhrbacteria bacterium]
MQSTEALDDRPTIPISHGEMKIVQPTRCAWRSLWSVRSTLPRIESELGSPPPSPIVHSTGAVTSELEFKEEVLFYWMDQYPELGPELHCLIIQCMLAPVLPIRWILSEEEVLRYAKTCWPWDVDSLPGVPPFTRPIFRMGQRDLPNVAEIVWLDHSWSRSTHGDVLPLIDPWGPFRTPLLLMGKWQFGLLCHLLPSETRLRLWQSFDWFVRRMIAYALLGQKERALQFFEVANTFHSGILPMGYVKRPSDGLRCAAFLARS